MQLIEQTDNISSVISSLIEHFDSSIAIWFRGQPTFDDELVPSIFRQGKAYKFQYNEAKMYEEFKKRYPEQSATHKDVYSWLTLMQHYGMPTRLLDWTTNLLVALYFACNKDFEKDGAVFAFNPELLNDFVFSFLMESQITSKSVSDFYTKLIYNSEGTLNDETLINDTSIADIKTNPFLQVKFTHPAKAQSTKLESVKLKTVLPRTFDLNGNAIPHIYQDITPAFSNIIPFSSPFLNLRIKQQHGCFTCHGGKHFDGDEFINFDKMEEHPYLKDSIVKIRIKSSNKIQLLYNLRLSGIRESTLFPEMEYQAKEIKENCTYPVGTK